MPIDDVVFDFEMMSLERYEEGPEDGVYTYGTYSAGQCFFKKVLIILSDEYDRKYSYSCMILDLHTLLTSQYSHLHVFKVCFSKEPDGIQRMRSLRSRTQRFYLPRHPPCTGNRTGERTYLLTPITDVPCTKLLIEGEHLLEL